MYGVGFEKPVSVWSEGSWVVSRNIDGPSVVYSVCFIGHVLSFTLSVVTLAVCLFFIVTFGSPIFAGGNLFYRCGKLGVISSIFWVFSPIYQIVSLKSELGSLPLSTENLR